MPAKKTTTWILVADGARARILVHEAPGQGLRPAMDHEFAASHAPTRDFGSDKPGRTFDSDGQGGRHAYAPRTDWHRFEKERFAGDLAAELRGPALENRFDRLVLVAPPQTLGDLRAALDPAASAKVSAEIDKDFTHLTEHQLAEHLEETLRA